MKIYVKLLTSSPKPFHIDRHGHKEKYPTTLLTSSLFMNI